MNIANLNRRLIAKIFSYAAMVCGSVAIVFGVSAVFNNKDIAWQFNLICALAVFLLALKFLIDITKVNLVNDIFWICVNILFGIFMLTIAF